ncbi:hypothetical protein [Pantoea sp. ACRSB]|uniref:hypothetical protein n=1 Tax=Pantoea sp. ACRSB TaxID=2918207 RepID=UPI00289356D2|nr:hypothetical protein [Pantoea sp. ACRSB]MCG7387299.1 hypothetical protein [Pantoea sp. ACRSB]
MAWYEVTGTVSDMVMAAAAVYAASKADDFFRAKKNEAALKAAITLYDDVMPKLYEKNRKLIFKFSKLEWYATYIKNKTKPSQDLNENNSEIFSSIAEIQNYCDLMFDCHRNIVSSRIGFKLKERKDFTLIVGRTSLLLAKLTSLKHIHDDINTFDKYAEEEVPYIRNTSREELINDFFEKIYQVKESHDHLHEVIKVYGSPSMTADEHFRKKRFFEK